MGVVVLFRAKAVFNSNHREQGGIIAVVVVVLVVVAIKVLVVVLPAKTVLNTNHREQGITVVVVIKALVVVLRAKGVLNTNHREQGVIRTGINTVVKTLARGRDKQLPHTPRVLVGPLLSMGGHMSSAREVEGACSRRHTR